MISLRKVAELLGVSMKTVLRRILASGVERHFIGGCHKTSFIRKSDLDRLR